MRKTGIGAVVELADTADLSRTEIGHRDDLQCSNPACATS